MRKLLFWTHLAVGALAAVVVFIMSVTGALLMYERQSMEWADRDLRTVEPKSALLPPEALLQAVAPQLGSMPDSLTVRSDARASAEALLGQKLLYVDPYTGRVLGESAQPVRRFFRVVTDLHRWLAFEGALRPAGRAVTGAANLAFLGLALSGMYLWLPRRWDWSATRAVLWFRGGLSGRARDFNWHNVIGIWCVLPLIAVITGALVISYPWATNLVYRVAGSTPQPSTGAPQRRPDRPPAAPSLTGVNPAFQQAKLRNPGWQTITWRPSAGPSISLVIAESHRGRVDLRSTLSVDRATGRVVETEQFSGLSRGRRWRSWLRFIHTGEALGVTGQTVAGIASAGAAVLAWTGVALTWRRFRAWTARRRRSASPSVESGRPLQSV